MCVFLCVCVSLCQPGNRCEPLLIRRRRWVSPEDLQGGPLQLGFAESVIHGFPMPIWGVNDWGCPARHGTPKPHAGGFL